MRLRINEIPIEPLNHPHRLKAMLAPSGNHEPPMRTPPARQRCVDSLSVRLGAGGEPGRGLVDLSVGV